MTGKIKAYTQTGVKFKGIKYATRGTYTYNVKITLFVEPEARRDAEGEEDQEARHRV